jgi:hypothetical protein
MSGWTFRRAASSKFNLVSVNFKGIGETNNTIQAILGDQLIAAASPALAERVHIYDRDALQYVQYARKLSDGLFYFATNFFAGSPVNPTIPNGTAFWLQSAGSAPTTHQIFVMGEVPETLTNGYNLVGQGGGFLQQIGNPFPVDIDLNTFINTNDGARGSSISPALADRLFIWDQSISNYLQYSLRGDSNKWFFATNFFNAPAPVATLRPGVGAWYRGLTNFTWNEPKPYTYP